MPATRDRSSDPSIYGSSSASSHLPVLQRIARNTSTAVVLDLGMTAHILDPPASAAVASPFSSSYMTFLRQFWEAQTISYEKGNGSIQWTWKAEAADEWSYQDGLANGWIPNNPTNRQYPNICGTSNLFDSDILQECVGCNVG